MILYIHAEGLTDTGRTFGRHLGREVRHAVVPENTPVANIANVVLRQFSDEERAALNGNVELLIVNCHGSPGRLHLSGVRDAVNDVDIHNADSFTNPFRPLLTPLEQGGEGVEIHGCGIAAASLVAGTEDIDDPDIGFRFIYALARGFDSRVMASASPQVSDYEGNFEDTIVSAYPDDDVDWHGHVVQVPNSDILHEGGFWTRVRAMINPPPLLRDPRSGGRAQPLRDPRSDATRRPLY